MDWEPIQLVLGKAAFAGLYAFVAAISVTKTLDESTLYITLGCAALRGLAVFAKVLHDVWKPKLLETRLRNLNLLDLL